MPKWPAQKNKGLSAKQGWKPIVVSVSSQEACGWIFQSQLAAQKQCNGWKCTGF
jgi:hypothetical protein